LEPVAIFDADDVLHLAGMVIDGHGNYWRKTTSWSHEDPTSSGGVDAVAYPTPNGVFYAEMNESSNKLELSRRVSGWQNLSSLGDADRPWLAYNDGITYLVTSPEDNGIRTIELRKTINGSAWTDVNLTIANGGAGNLTISPNGTFYLPYHRSADKALWLARSYDRGFHWFHELVNEDTPKHPFGAVDASENLYVIWNDDAKVYYRARLPNGNWSTIHPVSTSTTAQTWGSMGVSGTTGKLGIAWYTKEPTGDWEVHYTHITDAAGTPHYSREAITWLAAVGSAGPQETFRDFLSVARKSDGNVAIAFGCNWTAISDPPPCTNNGATHPVVAEQTGGPTL
jgi:hypothetical protein